MKKTTWVIITLLLLACNSLHAQSLRSVSGNKQFQLSLQNGLSSFLTSTTLDSVYFLKGGYQAGLQGNYYWNNFGLAGRVGYFSNAGDRQALEDFARSRKAPRDRVEISSAAYKGLYFFTGPAFQSSFNKWRLQSSLEGGIISKPASQILIGDNVSPDIIYYRNVFDESNSFAWSAGLSISYALSSQILLGVNADYLNTRNDVVNYDIQRSGGREAKNISSQAGFLNTGLRLSYLFNTRKTREPSSGLASGKRMATNTNDEDIVDNGAMKNEVSNAGKVETPISTQTTNDTCKCEDKVMDVREMEPYVVEIQFQTVQEARVFLDTYEPVLERRDAATGQSSGKRQHGSINSNPLYQPSGNSGTNPLYEVNKRTVSNTQGVRGIVHRNTKGEQAFYIMPLSLDLSEVLSLDDGRVTVHVQHGSDKGNDMQKRDQATGLANGKRMYKAIAVGDVDGDGMRDLMLKSGGIFTGSAPRDITNDPNISWGSLRTIGDVDGDGHADYCLQSSGTNKYRYTNGGIMHEDDWNSNQRRDVATGQSSGKRQHKPIAIGDLDGDGMSDLLIISYGHTIKSPRDVATGQSSGRVAKIDAFTIKQGIVLEADLDGDGEFEPLGNVKSPRDVATGQSSGKRTMAKEDVYVWKIKFAADLDGDGLADGFVCSGANKNADLMSSSAAQSFSIVLSDDNNEEAARKTKSTEGNQSWKESDNNKIVEKATSGIKQTMQTQVLMTNDNNSNGNGAQKAGISTSRSNIRTKKIISCSDGSCMIACEIELDGRVYSALITARAKHDTAKNAIGNIR